MAVCSIKKYIRQLSSRRLVTMRCGMEKKDRYVTVEANSVQDNVQDNGGIIFYCEKLILKGEDEK